MGVKKKSKDETPAEMGNTPDPETVSPKDAAASATPKEEPADPSPEDYGDDDDGDEGDE